MDKRKDKVNYIARTLAGSVISLVCVLLLSLLLAFIIGKEILEENQRGFSVIFITILSGTVGSIYTALHTKENVLIWCVSQGVVFFLILLGINALFFDAMYQSVGNGVISVLGTSALVAILYSVTKQRMVRRYKRR